jgi:hypothetical protein
VPRRIDIELTSSRDDGTWTWRAAGAKQPKGVVEGSVLYPGAKVGDVVRAEAEFDIEGITVLTVVPPKGRRAEPERLEIIGPPRTEAPGVTSSLVSKSERGEREGRGPRRDGDRNRGDGPRRPRERADRGPRTPGDGGGRPSDRGPRPDRGTRPERAPRTDRAPRADRGPRPERDAAPAKPKPKRLSPGNVHRSAVLADLSPEQRPIAEQVLKGGLPAVRQAIEAHNTQAKADSTPELPEGPVVAMAEALLPRLKAADWRDRAEAAAKDVDEIALRDLRSVVAGADAVARDDETRLLASTLREALDRRVKEHRERWVAEITGALEEGRLVRALRVAARPPDASSRFPADLAVRLSEAAGAGMSPDTAPDRWAALLEAVADSPVRRSVKPVGLPAEPGEALLHLAKQTSGKVPALAALLGIDMPPPPGPPRGARPPRPPRPPKPSGSKPRPPKPALTSTPVDVVPETPSPTAAETPAVETAVVETPAVEIPAVEIPAESVEVVEQAEDVGGPVEDDVSGNGNGTGVPAGESEPGT